MCRLLREIELFLTIRYAIKHQDIDLLEYCISSLIIFLLDVKQQNYAYEMLYYVWLLRSHVSLELRHSIMIAELINWQDKSECFKVIDLEMKHLNEVCKIEMKCYKNFTKNTHFIFDRVCLFNIWIQVLRQKLESLFDWSMLDDHTTASITLETFSTARFMIVSDLVKSWDDRLLSNNVMFDSSDILERDVSVLKKKIQLFNES